MKIQCIAASVIPSRTANSIQVMKVCDAMRRLDHEVRLYLPGSALTLDWDELREMYGIGDPFDIRWLDSLSALHRYDFGWKAVRQASSRPTDLLYVWQLQAAAMASDRSQPTIYELHDRPSGRIGPRLFTRFLRGDGALRLVSTTMTLNRWVQQNDSRFRERADEFYAIEPNGVSLEAFENLPEASKVRQAWGLENRFTAGYAGHLYSGRGIEVILKLAERNPEDSFVLAGGEEAAIQDWRGRAERMQLGNVRFLGHIRQAKLPELLSACDVLLMPYEQTIHVSSGAETSTYASPMKAIEYLAAGKPILSSDLPVFREVLNDDNAILLPPEDVEAWDLAYKRIRCEPERIKALGEAAARDVAGRSWTERSRRILSGLKKNSP